LQAEFNERVIQQWGEYMKAAKSLLIIVLILAFFLASPVSHAEDIPEGIIFVDKSGSVKKHDAGLKSRDLLIAFLRTLKKPFRIVLAGFNEEIYEYISVVTDTKADIEALAGEIEKIDAHSYCTDLEIPFRYLLEREGKETIKFALIISDGEPDIWDGKLRHFSKRVKSDPRYEHLNSQYRMLKASGLSPDELFERLGHLYHERNLELIEEQLSGLRGRTGDRILLWDLSGESAYLKSWAEKCGAQYLPMKTEQNLTPVDFLRYVTLSLSARSSSITHSPPSQHYGIPGKSPLPTPVEPKPETSPEQRPERAHATVTSQPVSPDMGDEPKKPVGQSQKQIVRDGVNGSAIAGAVTLFVVIIGGNIIMLGRFRKKAALTSLKRELEVELEGETRSIRKQRLSEMEAEVEAEIRSTRGQRLSKMEAELATEKERKKKEIERELSEYGKSVEQEIEAEKERKMQELEANAGVMQPDISTESLERKKELEAEVEGEIRLIREQRLSELEAELTAEKERKNEELEKGLSEYRRGIESEVKAEKEKKMRVFEEELSEYWKTVESEVKAEKEKRMGVFEKELSEYWKTVEPQ